MKIGIVSDSHDHIENLRKALEKIKERGCEVLIHCGDFCAPFMIAEMAKFRGEVHCCFGNTDDRYLSTNLSQEKKVNLHGDLGEVEIEGKKIAFTHLPRFAEGLAATGDYDLVLHGHTHTPRKENVNKTLLLNPGEIMGWKSKPSYAIYDTKSGDAEIVELPKSL